MTRKPCRKLTLLDLLLLVVAVAIGLAWTRHYQQSEQGFESHPDEEGAAHFILPLGLRVALWWVVSLYHCVAVVTFAMLTLRLRGPRVKLRRLTRQPGTVACAVVTFAVSAELIGLIPSAILKIVA